MCTCACMHTTVHMWSSEDTLWDLFSLVLGMALGCLPFVAPFATDPLCCLLAVSFSPVVDDSLR